MDSSVSDRRADAFGAVTLGCTVAGVGLVVAPGPAAVWWFLAAPLAGFGIQWALTEVRLQRTTGVRWIVAYPRAWRLCVDTTTVASLALLFVVPVVFASNTFPGGPVLAIAIGCAAQAVVARDVVVGAFAALVGLGGVLTVRNWSLALLDPPAAGVVAVFALAVAGVALAALSWDRSRRARRKAIPGTPERRDVQVGGGVRRMPQTGLSREGKCPWPQRPCP